MPDPKILEFTATTHHEPYPAIANSSHTGRVVLITGASRGLGRVAAITFAKAGARAIIIAARGALDEVERDILTAAKETAVNPLPQVLKLRLDVANETEVAKAASQVQQAFGKVDILLNNAGYSAEWTALDQSDSSEWWKTWEVNVKGVYLVTRAFLPLIQQGDNVKTIVNVSSVAAHAIIPGASAYQSTKLALLRLTEFIGVENEEKGITSFSIHPGAVVTELSGNLPAKMAAKFIDRPELMAYTVAWLTQERQQWLNGRYLSVTWDMPELFERKAEIIEGNKLKVRMVV